MIPPISHKDQVKVVIAIVIFAVGAAITVFFIQKGAFEISAAMAGLLSGLVALTQWAIAQAREAAKTRWEAVKLYYSERDSEPMLSIAQHVFDNNFDAASKYCNFFEKWGRLVQMGYMPIEIFEGSTGVHITNAVIKLAEFIADRRTRNPLYASSFIWLVMQIESKDSIRKNINHENLLTAIHKINRV